MTYGSRRDKERSELKLLRRPLALLLLTLLALAALPRLALPAVAAPRVSGRIEASEVRHDAPGERARVERLARASAAGASIARGDPDTLSLTSEVIDAGQRFDYVGVHWRAAPGREGALFVELRTSADGRAWSAWQLLHEEEDMADEVQNERYAAPLAVGDARYAQYRVWLTDGEVGAARSVALTFMDVSELNASPLARLGSDLAGAWRDFLSSLSAEAAVNPRRIFTRQDWGADESLMQWIPQYVPWRKAVVHHTATSNSYTAAAPEIRSIYYYHAITRGWGDIGYSFIVDKYGNIWTGRQGGDDAVGGHAYGWNEGSLGVAALGNFSVTAPSSSQLDGLAQIIAMKFAQRGLQPYGADTFTHKEEDSQGNWVPVTTTPPNVLGHRDCSYVIGVSGGQTSCPGGALYAQLNTVRSLAQQLVNGGFNNLVAYTTGLPRTANVGQPLSVPVAIRNVGRTTIAAGGPSSARLSYRIVSAATGGVVVAQGPLTALTGDIPPGGAQTLTPRVNVPATPGLYLVRWDLSLDSVGWFSSAFTTPFKDEWLAAVEWDDTWVSDTTPPTMSVGQTAAVSVTVKNTGARTWPAANVRLSYHWVSDVTQRTVVWNGSRALLPFDVAPGQQVTLPITVTAPTYPTRYRIQYDFVWEGQFWFGDKGVDPLEKTVNVPFDFKAAYAVPTTLVLTPDQRTTVPITITNTGTSTWPAGGTPFVELGTHWYTTGGALVEWDGLRTPLPQSVAPGQSLTMQANVDAPSAPASYQLRFDLALEGVSWFGDKGVAPGVTLVTVKAPTYGALYQPGPVSAIAASVQTSVPMILTNTGDFSWTSPAFALGYHVYDSANKLMLWDGARTLLPTVVAPGQSVTLRANLSLPSAAGTYVVRWDMVQEGVTWFSSKGVPPAAQAITIGTPTYGASYDASLTPAAFATRMTTRVLVQVTNASSFPFGPATNVALSYHWYDGAGNVVVWDGKRSAIDLGAGLSASVWTDVVGPASPGAYRLAFDLVQEGVAWFSGKGVGPAARSVSVVVPEYGAVYVVPGPQSATAGQTIALPLTVTNTGSRTWSSTQFFVAYHLYRNDALYVWDGARTALPAALAPGGSATVNASVRVPTSPGSYELRFDVVQEGVTWASGQGVPTGILALTAQ